MEILIRPWRMDDLPGFQGRGIGGRLLEAVEKKARTDGLDELWVGVMVPNEAACRWYDKRGFRFVREEPFRMGAPPCPTGSATR